MKKTRIYCIILLLCLMITVCFYGCKKGGNESSMPTESNNVKSITLNKDNITATVLETVTLSATTENITEDVVWSSSNTAIANVENGVVEAYKAGNVTVTATAEGVSASAQIAFVEADESKLSLVCENVNFLLPEGENEQLRPSVFLGDLQISGGAFSFATADADIASVSQGGVVTGIACGETTITVSGSIKGYTLSPVSFNVTVEENVKLFTGVDGDRVTIYLSRGKNLDHETQYTLDPIIKVKNETVENAIFGYENSNNDVASLEGNVLTARSVGATEVTISYVSSKGTKVEKTLSVVVLKPTAEILQDTEVLLGIKTANNLSVFGIEYDITRMIVNGSKTTLSVSGQEFTFNDKSILAGLASDVVIETDFEIYTFTADVYDYVIDTKAELTAFGKNAAVSPWMSAALTANIDYQMGNFFTDSGFKADTKYFYAGLLDGRGFTIYNIKGNNGIFYGFKNATVKNVAFFNVVRDTYNGGGALVHEMAPGSHNTIENVYMQVKFTAYDGNFLGGFVGIGNGTFRNVIVNTEFIGKPFAYNAWCASYNEKPTLENCYAISSTSNGYMYNDVTDGLYKDVASFNTVVNEVKDSFEEAYWKVVNGTLIFASTEEIVNAMYPMQSSISITNTQTQFDGRAIRITTDIVENVKIFLEEPYTGIALEKGSLLAVDSFDSGEVKLVAQWQHPIYGTVLSSEKTFTVIATQIATEADTRLFAKNRSAEFSFDLKSYAPTGIQTVEFNGETVAYQLDGNILKIAKSEIPSITARLDIFVASNSGRYIVKVPVEVVDFAIGTATELKAFGVGIKSNLNAVAVLTANIDYALGNFYDDSGFNYTHMFSGSLDGKGYTISNMKTRNGIFYGLRNATIKNIGFKNLLRDTPNGGGALGNEMWGSNLVENVYIEVKFTAYTGTDLAGVGNICEGTFKNVVVVADFQSKPGAYNAWGKSYNSAPILENCCAISSNSSGYMYKDVTDGLYTSMAEFEQDSETLMDNFDSTYWTVSNGRLVFKTAV